MPAVEAGWGHAASRPRTREDLGLPAPARRPLCPGGPFWLPSNSHSLYGSGFFKARNAISVSDQQLASEPKGTGHRKPGQ